MPQQLLLSEAHEASPLVPLRTSTETSETLICLPGEGASVMSFAHPMEALDVPWSVYDFQPRGLSGDAPPHSNIESALPGIPN